MGESSMMLQPEVVERTCTGTDYSAGYLDSDRSVLMGESSVMLQPEVVERTASLARLRPEVRKVARMLPTSPREELGGMAQGVIFCGLKCCTKAFSSVRLEWQL